jgi:hypothetical protein
MGDAGAGGGSGGSGAGRKGAALAVCTGLALLVGVAGAEPAQEPDLFAEPASVNHGTLHILPNPPPQAVHHHHNHVVIDAGSLESGWISLAQCHEHLDPVPRAEVVFHPDRTRVLSITAVEQVGRAWVEGTSVQLENVSRGARLCLGARTLALVHHADDTFSLRNGPFMRRFLDGYYPMRVTMQVELPCEGLELVQVDPPEQPGLAVARGPCSVHLDAWFEGRLHTELRLRRRVAPSSPPYPTKSLDNRPAPSILGAPDVDPSGDSSAPAPPKR